MAFAEIPIDTRFPDQEGVYTLARRNYLIRFRLNFRSKRWMMDIKTEQGNPILIGIPLLVNRPLIRRFKDVRLPRGELFVLDVNETNTDPTEFSFGNTHTLVFRSDESAS